MKKIENFINDEGFDFKELFRIKGGVSSAEPAACRNKACDTNACLTIACVTEACESMACMTTACGTFTCSVKSVPDPPPQPL